SSASVTVDGAGLSQNFSLGTRLYTLSGTVTDADEGLPISGATVSVSGGPSNTSNSTGGYRLSLANGTFTVTASAAGFDPSSASVTVDGAGLSQNFSLGTRLYTLSGTVTDAVTEAKLPGATVDVAGGAATTTNAIGEFHFSLTNGTYAVGVSDPGYQSATASIRIDGASTTASFVLAPELARLYNLTGQVTFGRNGSDASGVEVRLDENRSDVTDPVGAYSFEVANGSYNVSARAPGFAAQSALVIVRGADVLQDFALLPPMFLLHGMVDSRSSGQPIAGANVSLTLQEWRITSSMGEYAFLVLNSSYVLTVSAPGYRPATVDARVSGAPVTVNVSMTAAAPSNASSNGTPLLWEVTAIVVLGAIGGLAVVMVRSVRRESIERRRTRPSRSPIRRSP
ncbi:MAG: carboxypeptidase regulatory-like domain-containing protein, partial [Thermoplasmata archaeon]